MNSVSSVSFLPNPRPVMRSASDRSLPPVGALADFSFSFLTLPPDCCCCCGLWRLLGAVMIGWLALLRGCSSSG